MRASCLIVYSAYIRKIWADHIGNITSCSVYAVLESKEEHHLRCFFHISMQGMTNSKHSMIFSLVGNSCFDLVAIGSGSSQTRRYGQRPCANVLS